MNRHSRKFLFFAIAIVGVVSIVGTGFCVFAYSDESRADKYIGVKVEHTSDLGAFTVELPNFAVLEEGAELGSSSTLTGINFYLGGDFKKNDSNEVFEGEGKPLFNPVSEIKFKTLSNVDRTLADKMYFGMKVKITSGLLSEYMRSSSWYDSRAKLAANADYLDLKKLVGDTYPVVSGKENFEMTAAEGGGFVFTFRVSTTLLAMCFEYKEGKNPSTKEAYEAMVNAISADPNGSTITISLIQDLEVSA